jgi:deoxycytidylate deaminase
MNSIPQVPGRPVSSVTFVNAPNGSGPCAKQAVTATIVALNGHRYVGTNHCLTPQKTCPRGDLPTGVGYELCKTVCNQDGHAEVNAARIAGDVAKGATLYLEGHTYACDNCRKHTFSAGVAEIIIGPPPAMPRNAS